MLTVERRVELGKFFDDWLAELTQEEAKFILERCKSQFFRETPEEEMSDAQAKEFERQRMPFGAKVGLMIYDIDTEYLCNVTDKSPFWTKLKLYTKWRVKNESH
jgi:hypothetical protein